MKRPLSSPDLSQLSPGLDLAQAEQKTHQEELNLVLAKTALGKWEAELEEERNLPQQLRLETSGTNQRLLEIGEELKEATPRSEHPLLTDARRTSLLAEKRRCEAELRSHQNRLAHHEGLLALLTAERDAASREVAQLEALVKSWQAQVMKLRQDQATQARAEAEAAKKGSPGLQEPIQKELDINVKLGQDLERLDPGAGCFGDKTGEPKEAPAGNGRGVRPEPQTGGDFCAHASLEPHSSGAAPGIAELEPVSPGFCEAPPGACGSGSKPSWMWKNC